MTAPHTRSGWVALATELLGRDLLDWLDDRRIKGPFDRVPGWRVIADELAHVTDGRVAINWDSLRLYYNTNRPEADVKAMS